MTGIKIIAAVVDTQQLILYKTDGERVTIPQGDPRIRGIIDQVMPILNAGGVATISLEHSNEYARFEEKAGGLRLFRVAKKFVAHLFGADEDHAPKKTKGKPEFVPPMSIGQVPDGPVTAAGKQMAAVEEILSQATSVSSKEFRDPAGSEEDTMVAVVGEGPKAKVVPGVEALKDQMTYANKLGNTQGVAKLIERLSKVIHKRGHSVQDVLRFVEKGDLPIADDGSIIAYKVLKTKSGQPKETFFDCHTGNVPQKVGSYVCMDESIMDMSRRTECSVGLHIARRGYLGSFGGDVITLVKIAPEDVIVVPVGEPDKVRVKGYHILGAIPPSEHGNLRSRRPMTENADAQSLLGKAVSGQHIGRIEEVRIAGAHGTKITITPLGGGNTAKASPASTKEQPAPKAVALDDKTVTTKSVDPRAVAKESQEQKGQPSRTELASQLLNRVINVELKDAERMEAAQALQALKKRSKVGYGVLGLNMDHIQTLGLVLAGKAPQKPAAPKAPTKLALKQPEVVIPPKSEAKPQTRQEKAAYLLSTMVTGKAIHARLNAARDLVALKKSSKVSWNALGIDNNKDVEAILDLASKPIPAEPKVTNGQAAVTHLKTAAPKPAPKAPEKKPTAVAQPAKKPPAPVVASKPVHGGPTQDGPRQVEAKRLHLIMTDTRSGSLKVRQDHARQLLAHKKKTKVSWVALGLPQDMSKIIDDLLSQK